MTMTPGELNLLHTAMHKSCVYLEFGAGESTVYAAGLPNLQQVDCIESSKEYVAENLLPHPEVHNALATGKLHFHFPDIGKTGDWGHPVDRKSEHLWPAYSKAIFSEKADYGLVFVDGRFRVACTLNAILKTPQECEIIIHDFWNRGQYHIVLLYLDVKESADTMASFTKKKSINLQKLHAHIHQYEYLHDDKTLAYRITKSLPQIVMEKLGLRQKD